MGAELGDAEGDVADAEVTLNDANTALGNAQADVVSAESNLAVKNAVRATKQTEKNDAQDNHDAEIDSLNTEQAMLQQVIEILEDLLGRQATSDHELLTETNDHKYFKVQVSGVMSSDAIARACESAGYKALCSGPSGCQYNDENCLITAEAASRSNPMRGVSMLVCNTSPSGCAEFNGLYNYMKGWNGGSGSWCSNGGLHSDKHALCVL